MNKVDKNRPVSSIKHEDKRIAIPDSAHQGECDGGTGTTVTQLSYVITRLLTIRQIACLLIMCKKVLCYELFRRKFVYLQFINK